MIEIVKAIEINVVGVFSNLRISQQFNRKVGDTLLLHPIRTTRTLTDFKREIFLPGNDGDYLEKCVGKGNVHLKVSKKRFSAVRAISCSYADRNRYKYESIKEGTPDGFYKASSLLSEDEIESLAKNPSKYVFVHGFGEVTESNLLGLKCMFYESQQTKINQFAT